MDSIKVKINKYSLRELSIVLFSSYIIFFFLFKVTGFNYLFLPLLSNVIFFWSGFLLIFLLISIIKRNVLSIWEIISISIPTSFLVLTVLLFFISKLFFSQYLPLIICLSIFILFYIYFFVFKKEGISLENEIKTKDFFLSPLFVVGIFSLIFIFINLKLYSHLPDLDPYTWIERFSERYKNKTLGEYNQRSLFSSLSFFITNLSTFNLFTFYKYILPFFSVLSLIPIWLLAKEYKSKKEQYVILLSFFIGPSLIVAYTMPMPQSIWIILLFSFLAFLIYSERVGKGKNHIFFILAGIISMLGIFYHVGFSIFFAFWIIVAVLKYWKILWKQDLKTKVLILVIIFSNLNLLNYPFNFFNKFSKKTLTLFLEKFNLNIFYPLRYTNIEGKEMGWQSLDGVLKFYAYYAGPVFLLILLVFLFAIIIKKHYRKIIGQEIIKPGIAVVFLSLIFLFFIAEILPRFGGIALLPDRSWVFISIFSMILLLFIVDLKIANKNLFTYLFIFAIVINIAGAFYVNNLKKYLITKPQLESAQWIKENLPEERIIYSAGHGNLIKYHSESTMEGIKKSVYYDQIDFDNYLIPKIGIQDSYCSNEEIGNFNKSLNQLTEKIKLQQDKLILSNDIIEKNKLKQKIVNIFSSGDKKLEKNCEKKVKKDIYPKYIYYSKPDYRNPYALRAYNTLAWGFFYDGDFTFDKYPNLFKRIYEKDEVIIWKVENLTSE